MYFDASTVNLFSRILCATHMRSLEDLFDANSSYTVPPLTIGRPIQEAFL